MVRTYANFLVNGGGGAADEYRAKLSNALINMANFYAQFESFIQAIVTDLKKPIVNEIEDVVKLAMWKDINYESIKLAVQKSRSHLRKCARAYRVDVLGMPLTTAIA